jgi:hypothetical protein
MQVINPAPATPVAATPVAAKPTKTFRFEFSKSFIDELSRFSKVHQFDERRTYKEAWQKWKSNPEIDNIITFEVRRLEESGYVGDIEDKMFKSGRYYFRKKTLKVASPTTATTDATTEYNNNQDDNDDNDNDDNDDKDENIINPIRIKKTSPPPPPQHCTSTEKPAQKPAQQQRRPYITMSKKCIKMMDDHINAFSTNPEFKPSTSYDNFYQEKMSSSQMMEEIEVIVGKYEKTMHHTTIPSLEDIMHEIMDKIKKTYKNRYYRFANKK